jgi:hypothetical protein
MLKARDENGKAMKTISGKIRVLGRGSKNILLFYVAIYNDMLDYSFKIPQISDVWP